MTSTTHTPAKTGRAPKSVLISLWTIPVLMIGQFALVAVVPVVLVLIGTLRDARIRPLRWWAVALAVAYATPLALALTELVTNAVEHGLVGRGDGEVEIIASRNDESLAVKVRDNGGGLPEGKVGSGLGTQIVRTLIQGELGGTIDWHTLEGEGTEVTIDIPLLWLNRV